MLFRSHYQAKRRLCAALLLAWLFAWLCGTVQACVLTSLAAATVAQGPLLAHAGPPAQHAEHHHPAHGSAEPGHAGHVTAHPSSPGPSAAAQAHPAGHQHQHQAHGACHKFCQDERAPLPGNTALDDLPSAAMLLSLATLPLALAAPSPIPAPEARSSRSAHGPPIAIRFLRLAL